ncbi:MAG: T9SS type A sorting domain-containing protein [Flavobacteriales bacterium]|nr:T9SS type A sorting domain-containing protein [Flavobacteriales bacterium]
MRSLTPLTLLLSAAMNAQTTVTVTTAPANADQVWYSLQNGTVRTAPLVEWDLGFEIAGFTASILVNTAKGIAVFKAPYAVGAWNSLDTAGMTNSWTQVYDSDTSWSYGALNQELTSDEFDLGWGVYNLVTHTVAGDSLFVVHLANGDWKKLRIDGLAANTYTFTWADLDGSNETTGSLNKANYADKNFGYFSLENNMALDREPLTTDWDLLFTKYTAFIPQAYPVAGVLQNRNVTCLRVAGMDPALAEWTGGYYDPHINTIGYDWKSFNMQTFQYDIATDRCYFVKDGSDQVWKLIFTDYGGSATGDITFTQELISAAGIDEAGAPAASIAVYPDPVEGGTTNLFIDAPGTHADLRVLDASGRVMIARPLDGALAMRTLPLDVQTLSPGAYIAQVQGGGYRVHSRFIVR